MTKENLIPFIELDSENFWLESVNPVNSDSTWLQHGIKDIESVYESIGKSSSTLTLINAFLKMNYLLKKEYFQEFSSNIVLTNRRIFFWYGDFKKTIPLHNLTKYEKGSAGLSIEYLDNGNIQKFVISTQWLAPNAVNNALNKHKNDKTTPEELIITSNLRPTLNALYGLSNDIPDYNEIERIVTEEIKRVPNVSPVVIQKPKTNYGPLIFVCIFLLLAGGCAYIMIRNDNSSTNTFTDSKYNSVTGKKKVKCTWCGGIGRVGYAGDSKAQVERTGMGLGNECTRCNGTGWMDEDADK